MGEERECTAVGAAARLEVLLRDEQGGDEARRDQEAAHDHGGGGEQFLGVADPARGVLLGLAGLALDVRHHGDAGLEAGEAERELGEDDQGHADHHEDVAVFGGEGGGPVGDHVSLGDDVVQAGDHDDGVEHEVDAHQGDRDADRLQEALEEHRAEQRDEGQGDHHLLVVQRAVEVRVLDEVGRGVGGREGDGDQEVRGREAQQGQDEQLALPEGQQPFQHRDRTLAVRALLGHPPVDGQGAREGDDHEHDGGDGRQQTGREGGDAGLVAEGREVVDTGEAHDPVPGLPLLHRLLLGLRALRSMALAHVGQALQHPGAQATGRRVLGRGHRPAPDVRVGMRFRPSRGRRHQRKQRVTSGPTDQGAVGVKLPLRLAGSAVVAHQEVCSGTFSCPIGLYGRRAVRRARVTTQRDRSASPSLHLARGVGVVPGQGAPLSRQCQRPCEGRQGCVKVPAARARGAVR